jgi:NADPH-dependent curcumin reductase CurA
VTDAPVATTHRVIKMASHPDGALDDDDFELVDEPVPEPADGEALVRTLYLSLDPAIRVWMNGIDTYVPGIHVGDVMRAGGLGEVVQSRNAAYSEGDLVFGMMQWSEYSIARAGPDGMMTLPRQEPITAFLSVLGVTGLTAYFGMFDVAQPKEGETVVVSGAAGAVGSVAGQIGKIIGCRVVGIAGGPAKCAWITDELGFDAWIDYKSEDVATRLRETCPDGIDVFFDNVGGIVLNEVLARINLKARIVLCGAISRYNEAVLPPGPSNYFNLTPKRARMEGFIILDYVPRFPEAFEALGRWQSEGKLVQKEDVAVGLENAPRTLMRLFTGENFGKQLLRIVDQPLP